MLLKVLCCRFPNGEIALWIMTKMMQLALSLLPS